MLLAENLKEACYRQHIVKPLPVHKILIILYRTVSGETPYFYDSIVSSFRHPYTHI
jgi:hypothetical protein